MHNAAAHSVLKVDRQAVSVCLCGNPGTLVQSIPSWLT